MLYFSCTSNWSVRGFINNIIINTFFMFRTFIFRILLFVSTIASEEVLLLVLTAFHQHWNLDIWYRFIWYFFETCCFFIALFLHGAAGFLWVIFLLLVVCVMDLVFVLNANMNGYKCMVSNNKDQSPESNSYIYIYINKQINKCIAKILLQLYLYICNIKCFAKNCILKVCLYICCKDAKDYSHWHLLYSIFFIVFQLSTG